MNRIFVDTNIVIDLLAKRATFYTEAAKLFSLSDRNEIQLFISSLTFANTNYVLSKHFSPKEAREILRKFKVLVNVLSLDDKIIDLALSDEMFADFEDGLQYYTALESNIDVILTRNKKDFKYSRIPVLTAKEYLVA
jgi:predicted nucleic acid-binding protein